MKKVNEFQRMIVLKVIWIKKKKSEATPQTVFELGYSKERRNLD